ncbi:hypothetical protein [uncultured Bacteroides sp.]|uniref:hypothetical protein n=1 Tax=uncultured Bacteroides sp. TaxID=162156 RepID=UPI002AAB59FB|nr:hypothetical protein [uncultured Bacteroides sp.]
MKTKKTPYSNAHSIQLIPVSKLASFAIILSKAYITYSTGNYNLDVIPGSLVPDVQEDKSGSQPIYNINHAFSVPFQCIENEQELRNLTKQDLIAIYTNDAGQLVVSGSEQYPLTFSYSLSGTKYSCKLTGKSTYTEAFL